MNDLIWWVGTTTIALGATYSIAEGALWLLDRTLKSFGLWPRAWEMMRRMYRERYEEEEGRFDAR